MARGFFQITDIDLAVRMYYERIELSSADIMKLFGVNLLTVKDGKAVYKK